MHRISSYIISPEELEYFRHRRKFLTTNQEPQGVSEDQVQLNENSKCDMGLKASIRLSTRVFFVGSAVLTMIERIQHRLQRSRSNGIWCESASVPLSFTSSSPFPLQPYDPSSVKFLTTFYEKLIPCFEKIKWFGSWALLPFSFAQIFHSLFAGGEDVPFIYRRTLMTFPTRGLHRHEGKLVASQMGEVAHLKFPSFISNILFPQKLQYSTGMESLLRHAHPAIRNLSCAISHPESVSCLGAWARYATGSFWDNIRLFFIFYVILFLSKLRSLAKSPIEATYELIQKSIQTSTFATLSVATSWSSLCLFQRLLPRKFLSHRIFYVSGFLGGIMAFLDRSQGHVLFLDAARSAMLLWWRENRGNRFLRKFPSPEVTLFMASIAILNVLYDTKPGAITSRGTRELMKLLREPLVEGGSNSTVSSVSIQGRPDVKSDPPFVVHVGTDEIGSVLPGTTNFEISTYEQSLKV